MGNVKVLILNVTITPITVAIYLLLTMILGFVFYFIIEPLMYFLSYINGARRYMDGDPGTIQLIFRETVIICVALYAIRELLKITNLIVYNFIQKNVLYTMILFHFMFFVIHVYFLYEFGFDFNLIIGAATSLFGIILSKYILTF